MRPPMNRPPPHRASLPGPQAVIAACTPTSPTYGPSFRPPLWYTGMIRALRGDTMNAAALAARVKRLTGADRRSGQRGRGCADGPGPAHAARMEQVLYCTPERQGRTPRRTGGGTRGGESPATPARQVKAAGRRCKRRSRSAALAEVRSADPEV